MSEDRDVEPGRPGRTRQASSSPSRSASFARPVWTDETFIKSHDAEDALGRERPAFMRRNDIMDLIPRDITRYIVNPEATAHIKRFQELFVYLNNNSS